MTKFIEPIWEYQRKITFEQKIDFIAEKGRVCICFYEFISLVKKTKIEYEDDDSYSDDEDIKENPLDLKWNLFCSKIGRFSNTSINTDNHLHPPRNSANEKCNASDNFRLETAAPWLINFVCQEFEFAEKKGEFRLVCT